MARLTDEEREFRKVGAGIPFSKWWPVPVWFIVLALLAVHPWLLQECAGYSFDDLGRKGGVVRALLAIPCSPYLLTGSLWNWLMFAALWGPLPFAIINYRWAKRHRVYWNRVRLREAERRKEKRLQKTAAEAETNRRTEN